MSSLSPLTLEDWVSALAGSTPVPAGGALSLVTLAGAAALGAKMAGIGGGAPARLADLARAFLGAAEEDAAAYAATHEGREAKFLCLRVGLDHLEAALAALELLGGLFEGLPPPLSADVAAAARLAHASTQTLLVNLAVNASGWSDVLEGPELDEIQSHLRQLKDRLEEL